MWQQRRTVAMVAFDWLLGACHVLRVTQNRSPLPPQHREPESRSQLRHPNAVRHFLCSFLQILHHLWAATRLGGGDNTTRACSGDWACLDRGPLSRNRDVNQNNLARRNYKKQAQHNTTTGVNRSEYQMPRWTLLPQGQNLSTWYVILWGRQVFKTQFRVSVSVAWPVNPFPFRRCRRSRELSTHLPSSWPSTPRPSSSLPPVSLSRRAPAPGAGTQVRPAATAGSRDDGQTRTQMQQRSYSQDQQVTKASTRYAPSG